MRILEVISSLKPIGGGETFAVNISRSFQKFAELKVVILYKDFTQMFIDRLKEQNIDFTFLDKQKHFDKKNARELSEIIKDFKPDVIHTENNALIPTYLALKYIKKDERPYVFHTMHLAPIDECSNKLVKVLYRYILKKKKFIPVAITKDLSIESQKFYNLKKVDFVNNGVDLGKLDPSLPLHKRPFDVTVVARFSYQKNHEFLIRNFAEIKKAYPLFTANFVGTGELFEDMKQLAKNSGAKFINFMGSMSNPEEILAKSKIVALGSRFEANPLSLLEGLGSGCIPVSSDVGGVRNIIKEENGFLFKLDDDKKFIEIILDILSNLGNFETMSKNNVVYSEQFSIDTCAQNYIALFNKKI